MTDSNGNDPRSSTSYRTPASPEARAREAAIHHAQLLQERKDTEVQILESMELLIDYPKSKNSDAAQPSRDDVTQLKQRLIPFQPSDYDALIEERNINRNCGYVLCPNPNKLQGTKAKFGFLHSKGKGMKIVDQKALERWCCPECGKRALYLRVQLDEAPAWERVGGVGGDIVLLYERSRSPLRPDEALKVAEQLDKLDIQDGEETVVAAMKNLAIERGDGNARINSSRMGNMQIVEKISLGQGHQLPPELCEQPSIAHEFVEGYRPRKPRQSSNSSAGSDGGSDQEDLISEVVRYMKQ